MTAVETALEREISPSIMERHVLEASHLEVDEELVEQGEQSDELYLLLDGVLAAEVDGETVAEIGPGAVLGERAVLEGGARRPYAQSRR